MSATGARVLPLRTLARTLGVDVEPPPPGEPGDPGIFGPNSLVWQVTRERVLLLAGPPALLLQVAHPLVAAGVAAHSDVREDAFARLRATLDATLTITFGDTHQARAAAARVRSTHRRVRGSLTRAVGRFAAGTTYDATDPELSLWVHATLVEAALDGYHHLVRRLSWDERGRYFEEAKPFAELFGVTSDVMPSDYETFRGYYERLIGELEVGGDALELAPTILRPPLPAALRASAKIVAVATAGLLPAAIRSQYRLPWRATERAAFASLAATTRAALPFTPSRVRWWPHYARRVGPH